MKVSELIQALSRIDHEKDIVVKYWDGVRVVEVEGAFLAYDPNNDDWYIEVEGIDD